jgi:uncharacterized protein (DUF433 family)/DNA-binding transcriptional MerR regulator
MTSRYLGNGLYSIPDAADIIRVPANRLRHWVRGYYYGPAPARKHQVSVVPRFYGGTEEPLAFVELVELLFVARFRQAGLSMQYIRKAASKAREQFRADYPFAVRRFSSDGRRIFTTIDTEGRPKRVTHEIVYGQVVFDSIVRPYFKHNLDIEDDIVRRYWPLGRGKRIVVDAERAFGAPIDAPTGVPTHALSAAVKAGDSEGDVAEWFHVPIAAVRAALRYERRPVAA